MISVQTTGGLGRRMEVAVPAARVQQELEQRLRKIATTIRLDGFRPGKAPFSVIRQRFGSQVHSEVINELMQKSFIEAVTEQKLQPAGGPRIEPISTTAGQDLKYAATFEVYPEIKLRGLDSLQIERPVVEVKPEDIEAMTEKLREQRPTWKAVTRSSKKDDRVTVDFEGRIDGQLFEGGKGEDMPFVLGAGRMLPEFETGATGVAAGAETTVSLKFPEDYHGKEVAGKTAEFALKIKTVEEPQLPAVDEEFCKSLGFEGGVEELQREIAANLQRQVEEGTRAQVKTQLLDALQASNPLELPKALVDSQVSDMQVDYARRTGAKEISQIPPREKFEESARRRVSLGLLINEIIKSEKIEADRAKVQERLQSLVANAPNPQEALRNYQQNAEALHHVEALVLEDQVVDWLLSKAKVVERHQSFKDFTQSGS